ncbi:MAG: hypothetical protein QGI78_08545 [Phycisphaerales bacterium]|nr:hypothetical protein [Phycisphaerales bacterium]
MNPKLAVSMRTTSLKAKDFIDEVSTLRFGKIQVDALHSDLDQLTESGRRDLCSTLRRSGLRASGVDFFVGPKDWETHLEATLAGFGSAIAIAGELGRVPVNICVPDREDIVEAAVWAGAEAGVLVAAHRAAPLANPNIGWGLPVALLAKEERPMRALAGATFGPIVLRLSGEVRGKTTLELHTETLELSELRGVLDAMRWAPSSVIDAVPQKAVEIATAWESAGPRAY